MNFCLLTVQKVLTYMLFTEYDSEAKCPEWLSFLNEIFLGDQSLIDLLQEIFGACISNAPTSKAAIFYGSDANGKSVVANILEYLCGSNNVAHLSLDRFQSQFGLQSLIGKKLNIATELETGNTKITTANFKAIVSGDPVQVNIKYQAPLETVLNCKLVFLTNNLPDTLDTSYGYIRRLLIVPFNYTVPEDKRDVFLTDKLKKEISGILNWSIQGMLLISSFGADIKSVSELLGHSSTQITLNIYTHSVLKNKKDAIANFDNIIKKSS